MSDEKRQIFMTLFWSYDREHYKRNAVVTTHIGNAPEVEITREEMQDITYAARAEFVRLMQKRKTNNPLRGVE